MVLTTILAIRHGFRPAFNTNHLTGEIRSSYPSPTGIATDPTLTAYGVQQASELAQLAPTLSPPVARIYSSPAYRCIQTIAPLAEALPGTPPVLLDGGLWDWFGRAHFEYPSPADVDVLAPFFPALRLSECTSLVVPVRGETLAELQTRVAYVLARIVADAERHCTAAGPESIVISTHAAVLIALGRALTGRVPDDPTEKDFDTFTCSVSRYERRERRKGRGRDGRWEYETLPMPLEWVSGQPTPCFEWKGIGIGGGWDCTVNAGVEHLRNGGERNWHFSGEEGFVDAMKTADGKDGSSRL